MGTSNSAAGANGHGLVAAVPRKVFSRRGLLLGIGSLLAAPAIVRASSLMPVKALAPELLRDPMRDWVVAEAIMSLRIQFVAWTREDQAEVAAWAERNATLLAATQQAA